MTDPSSSPGAPLRPAPPSPSNPPSDAAVLPLEPPKPRATGRGRGLRALAWTGLYIALIPFINWSFTWAPNIQLTPDIAFNPVTVVTGLVLVVRDFVQRAVGHWVLAAMLVALGLTFATSGGALALASGAAFAISELVDWMVYTFTKRPLHQRIFLSSLFGAPIDSAVFLFGAEQIRAGSFTFANIAPSVFGKLLAAAAIAEVVRRHTRAERAGAQPARG